MLKNENTMLEKIKKRLRITWDYDDELIEDIIEEAKAFISQRVSNIDFETDVNAIRLLKEYCRYAWSGSVGYFEENYKSDIISLQIDNAIKKQ